MSNPINELKAALAATINALYGITPLTQADIVLQRTREEFAGDWTYVVFPLLKASRKKPEDTAREIGDALSARYPMVSGFEVVKGFLNLTMSNEWHIAMLADIAGEPHYGAIEVKDDAPLVMVEYSSPNTNKPLHLGHIRNNLLGFSIARILTEKGYQVVKTNIVNDRGIHICKSMLAWKKWGNGETPESSGKKGDHLVGDYYVLFDKHFKAEVKELEAKGYSKEEAEQRSPLMQEAREMLRRWEEGDEEVRALWRTMNEWVYEGFAETYRRLGVDFDKIYYESNTYLVGKGEVLRGLEEGILQKHPDGSVWFDLRDEGMDEKLLLRADGTSVYMTQDVGTAKMRFGDYPIDKMVYVVGNEQEYHFKVLSLLLDRLGFAFGKGLYHFSYGMVELPDGKMKSREGTVVDADDLMEDMVARAKEIALEAGRAKDFSDTELNEVAEKVGLGALKYFILKVDPRKNMLFNPKESIDFNGNTASFIQYTYARIQSLLERADAGDKDTDWQHAPLNESEKKLILSLAAYPQVVSDASDAYNPAVIANWVYDVVKQYNSFYHDYSVLREENAPIRAARLMLSRTVADVVERAMYLLGIDMPKRM